MKPKVIDRVNVIEDDRGYLNTKTISWTDLNDLKINGRFMGDNLGNAPDNKFYMVEVEACNDLYVTQTITTVLLLYPVVYKRTCNNGVWYEWQQIATTKTLNDRGYLQTKLLEDGYDHNLLVKNGKYKVWQGTNAPTSESCGWLIDVIAEHDGNVVQIAKSYGYSIHKMFMRDSVNGGWSDWQQLATTTKTEIDIPYSSAYVAYGNSYVSKISKCNNHVSVVAVFRTSSGQAANGISTIANIPVGFRPSLHHSFNGGVLVPNGIELRNNGDLMVNIPNASTYAISFEYYI